MNDCDATESDFQDTLIGEEIRQGAEEKYVALMEARRKIVVAERKDRREFNRRLRRRWREGIDLLLFLRVIALGWGTELQARHGAEAEINGDAQFLAILRIHGRACQITSEVIALLESGHASGAFGRWRSLHELAVIARFLHLNGQECARRYLDHHVVYSAKQATFYQEHCDQLGYERLDDEYVESIMRNRVEMVAKYGNGFGEDWGWASAYVRRATFRDIEKAADLDMWRPHYHWSSTAVHGGVKGMISDLGQLGFESSAAVILAGPSDAGLTDPASCMAISLFNCTKSFVLQRPTPEGASNLEAMGKIVRTMEDALLNAQRKLNEDEQRIQSESD